MITRKNIRISFCCISFFILLSCSKSDHTTSPPPPPPARILNAVTYTVTDTTGINHTYSDTAMLYRDGYPGNINGVRYPVVIPVAFIYPPDNNHQLPFFFLGSEPGGDNSISFSLPYFQATLSGTTNNFPASPLGLEWEGVHYEHVQPQPPGWDPGTVYLASFTTSTNISDSTGGYVTGSFNISATTIDSGKIQVTGKFSNLPTNYSP
jgi:hypothetical protein